MLIKKQNINNKAWPILSLLVMLFFNSCLVNTYLPSAQNAPLLREKGDVNLKVASSNVNAAYAINNSIGVVANAQFQSKTYGSGLNVLGLSNYKVDRYNLELGAGYYTKIDDKWSFETFGGFGFGEFRFLGNAYTNTEGYFQSKQARFFIQPNLGLRSNWFDLALISRFNFLKYFDDLQYNYTREELGILNLNNLSKGVFPFWEPGIAFSLGHKNIKFSSQVFMTQALRQNSINTRPVSMLFNLSVNLNAFSVANKEP